MQSFKFHTSDCCAKAEPSAAKDNRSGMIHFFLMRISFISYSTILIMLTNSLADITHTR